MGGRLKSDHPRSLWQDAEFLKLWGGQTISSIGSGVTASALPLTAVLVAVWSGSFPTATSTSTSPAAWAR